MADVTGKTEAEKKINMSALRKHDSEIDEIIDTASGVAHYKFRSSSGVWEKTDVEGSLFLYSRKVSPCVVIFILNRLNTENTSLYLTSNMEFKVQEPFLLCKGENSEIIGLWFYDPSECQRFGTLLSRLSVLAKDEKSLRIAVMMEIQKRKKDIEPPKENALLSMFNKAQQEFEQARGQRKKPNEKNKQPRKPNEIPRRRSTPNLHSQDKRSSPNETENNKKSQKLQQEEKFKIDHLKEQEVLLRILQGNNPPQQNQDSPSHRVRTRTLSSSNELEKKQDNNFRKFSSQAGDLAIFSNLGVINENSNQNIHQKKIIGCAELESELFNRIKSDNDLRKLNRSLSQQDDVAARLAKSTPSLNKQLSLNEELKPSQKITPPMESKPSIAVASNNLLSPSAMKSKTGKGRGTIINTLMNGQQKISIAANFTQSSKTPSKKQFSEDNKNENKFSEAPSGSALNSLITPAAFQITPSSTAGKQNGSTDNVNKQNGGNADMLLDKEQFKEALIHMIKTDERFVTALHQAYIEKQALH